MHRLYSVLGAGLLPAVALGLAGCAQEHVANYPPESSPEADVTTADTATPHPQHQGRAAGDAESGMADEVNLPTYGVVELAPTEGQQVKGQLELREDADGLRITGEVTGLAPGKHGFHIHEFGDLSDPAGKSAGGHFNPYDTAHGGPEDTQHHVGDLGNIEANEEGVAQVDVVAPELKLHFVLGRAFVVHGGEDDLKSQPSGDAGDRVAIGVIGVGKQ